MTESFRERLDGQVAIVTGASSGLGQQFARVLHDDGATVIATARRSDRLDALADALGPRIKPIACDLSRDEARARLALDVLDEHTHVDILVNNAGINASGPAEDEPLDDFRTVFEVNVIGLFDLCQRVGRSMLARGQGAIVNVASALGLVASAPINQASYCASKGAVIALTRELAVQWARRGVRVNALAPGWFPSELTQELWDDERSMEYIRRNTPIRRTGSPTELDAALRFLVDNDNGFYTGQVLTVDGGWTAR